MSDAWTAMSDDADTLTAEERAICRVADRYGRELREFATAHPDCKPVGEAGRPQPPAGAIVRRSADGWTVSDEIVGRLRNDMQEAQAAAREASTRLFSARHREAAIGKARRAQSLVAALETEAGKLRDAHVRKVAERTRDAEERRIRADRRVRESAAAVADAMRRLPPSMVAWNAAAWRSWSPLLSYSDALFGMLRAQPGQTRGLNQDFAWDRHVPTFVRTRGALRLVHTHSGRERALGSARSLILRALAATPPGRLRLSMFDPGGLGESVAPVLELGEYHRDLIGGKVWTSTEDLRRVLSEHTAHIELVIQKYLRAEYATLDEFNTAAGEIAEPYRLLVIFDAPFGFSEETVVDLKRILENGPRCGIGTLLVENDEAPAAHGVNLDRLPPNVHTVRLHAPFSVSDDYPLLFDLLPTTDGEAPAEVLRAVVAKVGAAAQQANSSVVGFERVFGLFSRAAVEGRKRGLPRLSGGVDVSDAETWWSQTTVESVAAPVGLRGARDGRC